MSDLTHMMNNLSPDDEGRYSDAVLDYYQGLVISGLTLPDDVIDQLAEREATRKAERESVVDEAPAQDDPAQDGLS